MKKIVVTFVTFGALTAGAVGLAGAAAAFPSDGSAADTVKSLQDKGFNVQLNGSVNGQPLSKCTVTGVHGLSNSNVDQSGAVVDRTQLATAFVDVVCPSH
jgi:hypothetical protein